MYLPKKGITSNAPAITTFNIRKLPRSEDVAIGILLGVQVLVSTTTLTYCNYSST